MVQRRKNILGPESAKTLLTYFRSHLFMTAYSLKMVRFRLVILIASAIIETTTRPFFILMPAQIIDALTTGNRREFFTDITVFVLGSILISAVILVIDHMYLRVSRSVSRKYTKDTLRIITDLPYEFFEDNDTKNMLFPLYKINPVYYLRGHFNVLCRIADCFIYSAIIADMHFSVLIAAFAVVIIKMIVDNRCGKYDYDIKDDMSGYERKKKYLDDLMTEFENAKEIRINNVCKWLLGKYDNTIDGKFELSLAVQKRKYPLRILIMLAESIFSIFIYVYAAQLVVSGKVTVGGFTAYVASVMRLTDAFSSLVSSLVDYKYLTMNIEIFKKSMDTANDTVKLNGTGIGIDKESEQHTLEFLNVSFKYPKSEEYTLRNISFTMSTGEDVALVGFNGAGKTTIVNLISGLYRPTEGKILFDGNDIWESDMEGYRDMLGVILQNFCVFPLSVKENVILDKEFDNDKWEETVKRSGLYECIDTLPNGYDTPVGKEINRKAVELSGGQAQKLAFARLIYRDSPIAVLDEPNAALDPYAEIELYKQYRGMIKDKMAMFISHRMSFSSFCGKILLIDNGRIIESGSHEELMKLGGKYSEMYSAQAQYYLH